MTHNGTIELQTERLVLRRFTSEDADALFRYFGDKEAVIYSRWSSHESISETRRLIHQYVAEYEQKNCYNWAIALRTDGGVIGRIAISHLDERICSADVSFFICKAYWGQGFVTEALRKVIEYLFAVIGVNRIVGRNDAANVASGAVMRKCGMKLEGICRQAGRNGHGLVDCEQYAIIANDYFNYLSKN